MLNKIIKNKELLLLVSAISIFFAGPVRADLAADLLSEFGQLEKSGSASGQAWFDLAGKAREAGSLDIAGQALDRASTAGFSSIRIGAEKARLQVVAKEPDLAIAELQGLVDKGFTAVGFFTADPVINSLAGNPGYDTLIADLTRIAYPCEYQEGFHDFDFWIGDWDVHIANGTIAGTNSITREERGCVLVEHWKNAGGGTGMSVNYLDMSSGEWVQIWNAEGGSQINIRGGLTPEGMAMAGTIHNVGSDVTSPFRALWTLLPDGRVRQYFEQSNDGGATWSPWFEGFYTRKGK
jgi:hypothetical protein